MSTLQNSRLSSLLKRKLILAGSATLGLTTVLSYVLGLFRNRLFAQTFGATRVLDAYNAAFIVPDLILNIFVAGALSAAFIPIFSELSSNEEYKKHVNEFTSSVLNGSILVILVVGSIAFIAAPILSNLIVPGFDEVARLQYISLTRILLLAPIVFAISNTLGGILITKQRFLWFGLSAALYNLGIILGILILAPTWGIYGAATGALAGSLLHLSIRVVGLLKYRLKYRFKINFDKHYRSFLRLMAPKMIGHPIEQITFFAYTIIASSMAAGSIVVLNFARNFQSAPVAIIGINIALASFSTLSVAAAKKDRAKFVSDLRFGFFMILLLTGISALILYVLRVHIISLLFGGGAFDQAAVLATASALGVFTLAIPTESANHLLSRAFYSLKNSMTPVIIGILTLTIAIVSGYFFSRNMGVNGLVLGFVVGSYIKIALLSVFLRKEVRLVF